MYAIRSYYALFLLLFPLNGCPKPTKGPIAFVSDRDGIREVYTMNQYGGAVTRLTHGVDGAPNNLRPVWSPDGKKIAFRTDFPGNSEIQVINADGSNLKNISNNPATDVTPNWSP